MVVAAHGAGQRRVSARVAPAGTAGAREPNTPLTTCQATASAPTMKTTSPKVRTQRSVYFDLNSADIKGDYDPALRAHARYLADNPKARVRIEGNADERGSADYNRRLGLKRADNVRAALLGAGAGEKQVHIRSLGESRPKLTGRDEESWAENRRGDILYKGEY